MRTQYLPNQFPRWFQIAYQSQDTEYTNLVYSATNDRVYVAGTTLETSTSFTISNTTITKPATTSKAAFVACLTAGGAYVWHSWIVGSGDQIPTSLALDSSNTGILVSCTSTTTDTSFNVSGSSVGKPVTVGISSVVLNFNTSDGSYNWSSWIDGSGDDYIRDMHVGSDGSVYYVGDSTTTGIAIDIAGTTQIKPATTDTAGFWVKLTSVGAFVTAQWIYGSGNVFCRSLRIDSLGNFFVCGDTVITDTSFIVAGTAVTKPATTFVSTFVIKMAVTDGSYVWDRWLYTSLNMYGNTLCLDTTNDILVGGRSNETGTSFYVSGVQQSKPSTNNYAGYIVRFASDGTYISNSWIDGPDYDYVTEMIPSGDLLFVLGSSSTGGTEITVNGRTVIKPATLNSAGFVFALVKQSLEYLYGLWLDGTQNEYNRSLAVSGDRVFFTGISNSNETTLQEGGEMVAKPSTTAVFGYTSMYQLDMNVLLRNPLLQFATVRTARMYNVVGRGGFTPVRTLPRTNLRLLIIHGQTTTAWNNDVVNKITNQMAIKFPNRILTVTSQTISYTGSDLNRTNYDVVFVYSNNSLSLPAATLQSFIDNGGGVVFSVFIITTIQLSGFNYASYSPVDPTGTFNNNIPNFTLGNVTAGDPLVDGVTTFNAGSTGYGSSTLNIYPGSQVVAFYNNNTTPLIVKRTIGSARTVALNFFPPSTFAFPSGWISGTNGDVMWANAINWVCPF